MSAGRLGFDQASPEIRALAHDPVMAEVTRSVGDVSVGLEDDRFVALARAIVGQQLSTKAASTIWGRFAALGPLEPAAVLGHSETQLRGVGLSGSKCTYVRDLAHRVASGDLDLESLDALDDDAVIADVTRVKGIGRWTAEMFLIFCLARPDVLAVDDNGLLRAGGWALGLGRAATGAELAAAGEAWRPFRTAASLYLWASLDRGLVPRTSQPGGLTPREGS
ncbi:MAG: DNA-3-methyladenine glycosylase 2 family protein [Coriobacteriia bacterium]|nr:DNA-3-methyladenine glycosylase 2 family protein [Coriobacteriia bacterium]